MVKIDIMINTDKVIYYFVGYSCNNPNRLEKRVCVFRSEYENVFRISSQNRLASGRDIVQFRLDGVHIDF